MKTLHENTIKLIDQELRSIPEEYQKDFNSNHEGYAVLLEEVRELEHVVFFGAKEAKAMVKDDLNPDYRKDEAVRIHKKRLLEEAVQIAAMAARIIQELT